MGRRGWGRWWVEARFKSKLFTTCYPPSRVSRRTGPKPSLLSGVLTGATRESKEERKSRGWVTPVSQSSVVERWRNGGAKREFGIALSKRRARRVFQDKAGVGGMKKGGLRRGVCRCCAVILHSCRGEDQDITTPCRYRRELLLQRGSVLALAPDPP